MSGTGNDLSLVGRKVIILTSADILPIWPLGTIFSENLIKIQTFSVKRMQLKVLSANWQPFCSDLNRFMYCSFHLQGSDGQMYQVWFDNLKSLKIKYDLAVSLGLRGVGMWEADALDYTNTTVGQKQRQEMWGALPDYKKERYGSYGGRFGGKWLNGVFNMWSD